MMEKSFKFGNSVPGLCNLDQLTYSIDLDTQSCLSMDKFINNSNLSLKSKHLM